MSGKKKKNQKGKISSAADGAKQSTEKSLGGPARRGAANDGSSLAAAAASSGSGGDAIIRDLLPPSQTVQPRGAAAAMAARDAATARAAAAEGIDGEEVIAVVAHLAQPIPMTHSYSLPSLPTTSLRPRMNSGLVEGGGLGMMLSYNPSAAATRTASAGDFQQPPTAALPLLSRTLSTPESSSSPSVMSAFGRAGSAFGRFAGSRPATTYTQSDPGFSAFHPVTWNCQRSLSSAGSGSLVGSEIIEEHDQGLALTRGKIPPSPSNNKTRGFLLKACEKFQTTKRRSGRENPARPSLSDTEDASSPPTTIVTNNDDGVEISVASEDKSDPPKIERVSPPSKIGALRKKGVAISSEAHQHNDPGLELDQLNFSESDDEGTIAAAEHQTSIEVALRHPSRAEKTAHVPFDEGVQTYYHTATTSTKTSTGGGVAAKFKFKSPRRRSKAAISPSSHTTSSSSPHQSPNAATSSSSNESPNSRGGLSTISSNSNSVSIASNVRISNSTASSPRGGDSCAMNTTGSSSTDPEVRDIVKRAQKNNKRQQRPTGKAESYVEDCCDAVSVDMDGNATVISSSTGSCSSAHLREGAINPHIPGRAPSVSPHHMFEAAHQAPFDERSSWEREAGGSTDSPALKKEVGISKFISYSSTKIVRSQSPHSTDEHQSSASASNASVSNGTSSSSGTGGGSLQPVKFVAYASVEEREESPFDEHHHEESRAASHQNLIRPTVSNEGSSSSGQRPPISPRKMASVTPPPTQLRETPRSGANTPCSPPTILDGPNLLVTDFTDVASTAVRRATYGMNMPKTNRLNMILVPPRISPLRDNRTVAGSEHGDQGIAPTVSLGHCNSQANVNIEGSLQQEEIIGKNVELFAAIVSPEKST